MTGSVGEDPRRSRYVGGAGPTAAYLMDDPRETTRLVAKVDPAAWAERYLNPDPPGRRVVEVGSGPLHLLAAAADRVSAEVAVGVDVSLSRLTAAAHRPAEPGLSRGGRRRGRVAVRHRQLRLQLHPVPAGIRPRPARHRPRDGSSHPPRGNGDAAGPRRAVGHAPSARPEPRLGNQGGPAVVGRAARRLRWSQAVRLRPSRGTDRSRRPPGVLSPHRRHRSRRDPWSQKLDIAAPAIIQALGPAAARTARDRFFAYLTNPATLTFSTLFTVTGTVPP